jgi:hypothetical protein
VVRKGNDPDKVGFLAEYQGEWETIQQAAAHTATIGSERSWMSLNTGECCTDLQFKLAAEAGALVM